MCFPDMESSAVKASQLEPGTRMKVLSVPLSGAQLHHLLVVSAGLEQALYRRLLLGPPSLRTRAHGC
jgi:hypothetical protein